MVACCAATVSLYCMGWMCTLCEMVCTGTIRTLAMCEGRCGARVGPCAIDW